MSNKLQTAAVTKGNKMRNKWTKADANGNRWFYGSGSRFNGADFVPYYFAQIELRVIDENGRPFFRITSDRWEFASLAETEAFVEERKACPSAFAAVGQVRG
jgi:hypothetical protein